MNGSNFSNFENGFKLKEMNLQDNSSGTSVELFQNSNYDKKEKNLGEYENENVLLNDKPILDININTLQNIRISHSIENSKNSQSLIDILNENKFINLNNEIEENNENDVNINNRAKKKIKKENKKNNKDNENISRNLNIKTFNSIHTNNNKNNKDIYTKFKIGDIFKERLEEKTKTNKILYNKKNKISKNNNKNNKGNTPKTLEYQNKNNQENIKLLSNIKNKNNEFEQLKENDSVFIEPDSIEINNSKNNKIILETFDIQNSSEKDDKNIMVSELDIDISNSIQNNNNINNNEMKIKNTKLEKAVEYTGPKKHIFGANHIQTKLIEKNKLIKKKIYPIRKINLNTNIHKKNIIQLKKRSDKEKNNTKYKNAQSTSSTKFPK